MTWRDTHFTNGLSTLKVPADNGTAGGYLSIADILSQIPASTTSTSTGLPYIDLSAPPYSAPLDGASHMMTQAAALAMYPNCGATASMEQDTAAWYQCEHDIRTSAVRTKAIIKLPMGATMKVQPLVMLDASRVGFDGDLNVTLLTAQCGTTPAITIQNGPNAAVVMRDIQFLAQASRVAVGNTGGVAHTLFTTVATAIHLDNVQGVNIERVGWNGYDMPVTIGNDVYGIIFDGCGGGGNNVGFGGIIPGGLNSWERIVFRNGALANNNYGFWFDLTYGPDSNGKNQYAQGGSVFIEDSAVDYNLVRQGIWISTPNGGGNPTTYSGASLHVTGCHIETTDVCSGTALCRIYSRGTIVISDNEPYENGTNAPIGFVEVADGTAATVIGNEFSAPVSMPICYSATANAKRVEGYGNIFHDAAARPILLQDGNGTRLQPSASDGSATVPPLFNDIIQNTWPLYYGKVMLLDYFAGPGSFTLPNRTTFAFPLGTVITLINIGANIITITVDNTASGATLTSLQPNSPKRLAPGAFCYAVPNDTSGQWLISGQLTV